MTTPRARMRRVLETIIESDLLDADEWLWLDKEVRAALAAEADRGTGDLTIGPIQHSNSQCRKDACDCWCQACERHVWRAEHDGRLDLASPDTVDLMARALRRSRLVVPALSVDAVAAALIEAMKVEVTK